MRQEYSQYVKNLKTIRSFSKIITNENDSDEEIIEKIKYATHMIYTLKEQNDTFLSTYFYPLDPNALTLEEIKELHDFAGELFHYADSLDVGLSYKIHKLLLECARIHQKDEIIIEELYYCGITLYYLNLTNKKKTRSLFGETIRSYFREGATYIKYFEKYDHETRYYILRCLGNQKIALPKLTREEVDKYYETYDDIMRYFDDEKLHEIDPEINWELLKYGMCFDQLVMVTYLTNYKDPEIASRFFEAAQYVYDNRKDKEEERLQNWRVNYFYAVANYFVHKASAKDVVNVLLETIKNTEIYDASLQGVKRNLSARAHLIYFASLINNNGEFSKMISDSTKDSLQYLNNLSGENSRRSVADSMVELINTQMHISKKENDLTLKYLMSFHKPTYVHSKMVAVLTKTLITALYETDPSYLIGVLDTKDLQEVLDKKDEIIALAYECGLYHDIGKNMVLAYININERKIIDEEFSCIKYHTIFGYDILHTGNNDNLAYAALYHHAYYDGSKGYPNTGSPCPKCMKPIVDIISVADSIDAATDDIGRYYKDPKTIDTLIEELRKESGTRYSPTIVNLFNNAKLKEEIENNINKHRLEIYVETYRQQ